MSKIFVYLKNPLETPKHVWINNTLEALQEFVGGYIETVTLCTDLIIICNEEGRINGMPYNCTICGYDFYGPIILVSADNNGNLISTETRDEDIKFILSGLFEEGE